jgi:hypothetical protein
MYNPHLATSQPADSPTVPDVYEDGWESDFPQLPNESAATRESIPPRLDSMAPGPVLAAYLASIDTDALSGYDRVVVLRARQRMASHYAAAVYSDMTAVADAHDDGVEHPEHAAGLASAEVRAALHLTRRSADIELSFALDLRHRLPLVHHLLSIGAIDVARAKMIDRGTCHLSVSAARGVVERIAEAAPELTTGQIAARIRKLCIEAHTDEAEKRYKRTVKERRVFAEPTVNGTANLLGLDLPPDRVTAVTQRINQIARSLRGSGETRTMDQLRSDVYLDLLQGTQHSARSRGVVHMTVDLDTLAHLTDHPGELDGFTPVVADIARQVAQDHNDAKWSYTVTDTETGQPIHTGTTRRRPTASQRRSVEARDKYCIFPGCRMPTADCDLDHTTSWAENGATHPDNLGTLCRSDHLLKHNGWTYQALPDGRYQWTSPLGHTYTTRTEPP